MFIFGVLRIFNVILTKFKNNPYLLNKISHPHSMTTKLFTVETSLLVGDKARFLWTERGRTSIVFYI